MTGGGYTTPLVNKLAREHHIDLAAITGTGVGGRITAGDVRAAAGMPRKTPAAATSYLAPNSTSSRTRPTFMQTQASRFDRDMSFQRAWGKEVTVNAFAANPVLDDLQQADPTTYQQALRRGAPPTLFESGDLPIFTATGFDPAELVRLPWAARHAAASSSDPGKVQEIFDRCGASDLESAVAVAGLLGSSSNGNANYIGRITGWATGVPVAIQLGGLS